MQIGVIGATGTIGSRIVSEAQSRGHHVTAFSRDASQIQDDREGVTWKTLDVTDASGIAAVLFNLDVLISGFGPGNTARNPADAVARAIADPKVYVRAAAMRGHGDALNVFRASNRLWTYFSPAIEILPGERTGRFRIGGDQPVMDADGRSRVSVEDAAVAVIDEVELPRFVQRRFTVGY